MDLIETQDQSKNNIILDIYKSLRIKQWIKNLVIPAVGFLCIQSNIKWSDILDLTTSFFAFCFCASSIYLINDYLDRDKDRSHPVKKFRPIASGKISSLLIFIILFVLTLLGLFLASTISNGILFLLTSYLIINLAYCLRLKHIPQIDIVCIASGFSIRTLAGASTVGCQANFWIIGSVTFACVSLTHMKRIKEIQQLGNSGSSREVLKRYNYESLSRNQDIFTALSVLSFLAYLSTLEIQNTYFTTTGLIGISAFLMTISSRIQNTTESDPTEFIYKNKLLSASLILFITCFITIYTAGIL